MRHLTYIVSLAGLLGIAGLGDSSQTTAHTSIQTLMLTTYEGKEAEYIDMKAYNIDYCLHPPNTTPSTPLRYYIDGELVFECNTNETAECKAYGLLKGNVKHPKSKNKTCPFLQFFKVPLNLLNRHYICCTPNDTFYRYLQTDKSPAPSLPKEFQQLCGHQKENKTEAVHDGASTEEENKTTIITIGSVLVVVVVAVVVVVVVVVALKRRVCTSRGMTKHPEPNNNLHAVEEGMTPTGEATQNGRANQQLEDQENEPLSSDLNC
ncbi:uncharacterized protein LOC127008118 isoform X2 [Eriocheir sinensis]|uniref:uncharacterized protein LOC127008118 isoform X2 n=1 Tax=Eriocheir sinensis TaxID=95602 RepID=UPI0021C9CFD0|nr:uncharacterized protein LOC127008118 isoform X2 [Eriocheir sinensis]